MTFHGHSIVDIENQMPKSLEESSVEPLPEGMLYLLLTGKFPQQHDVESIGEELKELGGLNNSIKKFILGLPKEMHSMTMLSMTLLFLQNESVFFNGYKSGIKKPQYWEYIYDDAMTLIAKIPAIAAAIYRHKYKGDQFIESNPNLDWAGNFSHMLGYDQFGARECLRGYLAIHCDHDGGNVSAHTTQLVGSALADPYLAFSAGLNGLAGPLHGLANQESLKFLIGMSEAVGDKPSNEDIVKYVKGVLASGKVVPGYGHAVLRDTDPRFTHQKKFALRNIQGDPLVDLMLKCSEVIPEVLIGTGKVSNPYPNVDANSGVLLHHYGLTEYDYYTVVFGVSRVIGCMSNLILSRAFGLPIERPDSVDMKWIKNATKV